MNNTFTRQLTLTWDKDGGNKVKCIKALRSVTGLGLKESKELLESSHMFPIEVSHDRLDTAITDLRNASFDVGITDYKKYTDSIKEIVTLATLAGDYYVAKTLITLLEERF